MLLHHLAHLLQLRVVQIMLLLQFLLHALESLAFVDSALDMLAFRKLYLDDESYFALFTLLFLFFVLD